MPSEEIREPDTNSSWSKIVALVRHLGQAGRTSGKLPIFGEVLGRN